MVSLLFSQFRNIIATFISSQFSSTINDIVFYPQIDKIQYLAVGEESQDWLHLCRCLRVVVRGQSKLFKNEQKYFPFRENENAHEF